ARPERPAPSRNPAGSSDRALEFELVTQRDAVGADRGDQRLEPARLVQRVTAQGGEVERPALVEAQRVEVVVGRGEQDPYAAVFAGGAQRGLQEQRTDACRPAERVDRDDLQRLALD